MKTSSRKDSLSRASPTSHPSWEPPWPSCSTWSWLFPPATSSAKCWGNIPRSDQSRPPSAVLCSPPPPGSACLAVALFKYLSSQLENFVFYTINLENQRSTILILEQFLFHGDFECQLGFLLDVFIKDPSLAKDLVRRHQLPIGGQDLGILETEFCWRILGSFRLSRSCAWWRHLFTWDVEERQKIFLIFQIFFHLDVARLSAYNCGSREERWESRISGIDRSSRRRRRCGAETEAERSCPGRVSPAARVL